MHNKSDRKSNVTGAPEKDEIGFHSAIFFLAVFFHLSTNLAKIDYS